MTTNQPSLLQLAKQGNAKAIAALLNHSLQPKGITAKVAFNDGCLQVMLESAQVPNQQALVKFIYKRILSLETEVFKKVRAYGKRVGEDFPIWTEEFELTEKSSTHAHKNSPEELSSNNSSNSTSGVKSLNYQTENKNSPVVTNSNQLNGKKSTPSSYIEKNKPNNLPELVTLINDGEWIKSFPLLEKLATTDIPFLTPENISFVAAGLLIVIAISLCSSLQTVYLGISLLLLSIFFLWLGLNLSKSSSRKEAEESLSGSIKREIEDFKSRFPKAEIIQVGQFEEIDDLCFAVSGVSYENNIVAYYKNEHLGSVVVDTNWGAVAKSVENKKPINIDITGKGVVIEIVVYNHKRVNDLLGHQSFCLIDNHSNQYSEHPMSKYVSSIRGGITNETNLRPGIKATYFVAFDVNPNSVALILTAKSESSGKETFFSLDLEQKILL
jgi:hypothetical protein